MKKILFVSFVLAHAIAFTQTQPSPGEAALTHGAKSDGAPLMILTPKDRAKDYKDAYDYLMKNTVNPQVFFILKDGTMLKGITDITILSGETILIFKMSTPIGIKYQVVPVENIMSVNTSL
ncbi:MAG: hypothetical protein HY860_04030 [Chlamydiales bacterium]|nr:hypothetical protein [Chlamydiales bacterium]